MLIAITEADALVRSALEKTGYTPDEAVIIADHVMGCELRGVSFGGLSRALSLIDRQRLSPRRPTLVARETPISALIDGQDQNGYLVAYQAMRMGLDKAKTSGLALIGANNTWYSGMYAHYLEIAANEGMIAMVMGSSAPRVAPHGSSEGRFGTNPIGFGFPADGQPIILDLGTSITPIAEVVLAHRLGNPLPEHQAFDAQGQETTDPMAALSGAIRVWGGHKGSGLALVVQMMGILMGGGAMPADYRDCGFVFLAVKPDLFMDPAEFKTRIHAYAEAVRAARPVNPDDHVRMPFDRSAQIRKQIVARGTIEVADTIIDQLQTIARNG